MSKLQTIMSNLSKLSLLFAPLQLEQAHLITHSFQNLVWSSLSLVLQGIITFINTSWIDECKDSYSSILHLDIHLYFMYTSQPSDSHRNCFYARWVTSPSPLLIQTNFDHIHKTSVSCLLFLPSFYSDTSAIHIFSPTYLHIQAFIFKGKAKFFTPSALYSA